MMHRALLALIFIVSVSSASFLKKSIVRRQSDAQQCQVIQGFDCKCSHYRVTCTTEGDLQSGINILPNQQEQYASVELVIQGEREYSIYDSTFEPIKQLYKTDVGHLDFRVKFEKFTALHLRSPGIFNRVFSDNLRSKAKTTIALEIYNPLVQPHENANLFQNLNVNSLELYVLYPFRSTFQQLFQGANIQSLRLSGGDITSDLSQPFSGNIGRLEIVKQASSLSVQNFPLYPVHEMAIDAFYVSDFNSENPPNYSNLGEIRIYTQERIPANAFQQYPNLHTLSITTDKEIDPQALNGLSNVEKLTIKDATPSLDLLAALPRVKEFETSVSKLDERAQCQLIEKLANGQIAVQSIYTGDACTCASAYLEAATRRPPCHVENCKQSSCAAIRDNYDASTNTFKSPPPIRRADGSDALQPREPRVHSAPYQVSRHDQEKYQQGRPPQQQQHDQQQHDQQQHDQHQQPHHDSNVQQGQYDDQQQQQDGVTPAGQTKKSRRTKPRNRVTTPTYDHQAGGDDHDHGQHQPQPEHPYHPQPPAPHDDGDHHDHDGSMVPSETDDQQQQGNVDDNDNQDNTANRPDTDDNANQQGDGQGDNQSTADGNQTAKDGEGDANQGTETIAAVDGSTESAAPAKKGMSWLIWVIIAACVVGLILALVLFFCIKQRKNRGYNQANTNDPNAGTTTRA